MRSYGGIRRLAYFGYSFLAGIIYQLVVLGLAAALGGGGGAGAGGAATAGMGVAIIACVIIYFLVLLYIVSQRLINIGSSPWWCLGMIVPLLNIFVGVRCLVCPEGYADHKTLDGPAKIILGIAIAAIVLAVLAIVFVGFSAA